jgi:hypothetical protein
MSLLPEIVSYSELGGTKSDYSPVVDSSTDRSAAEINKAFAAVSQLSRTSIRAWVKFHVSDTEVTTLTAWEAVWKSDSATVPVVTGASGNWTITWPTTVTDPQGTTHSVNFLAGWGNIAKDTNTTASNSAEVQFSSANVVNIWFANDSPLSCYVTIFLI